MDGRLSFWGVEVKPKEPLLVDPSEDADYIHISQAALGAAAKDNERVVVSLKQEVDPEDSDADDEAPISVVVGTLCKSKVDQMPLDLVLDQPFTLTHTGSHSIFLSGYKTRDMGGGDDDFDMDGEDFSGEDASDSEEEEEEEEKPVVAPTKKEKAAAKAEKKEAAKDTDMKEGAAPAAAPAAASPAAGTPKGQKRPAAAPAAESTPSPALTKSQKEKQKADAAVAAAAGASPASTVTAAAVSPAAVEVAKPAAKEAAKPAQKTPTPAAKPAAAAAAAGAAPVTPAAAAAAPSPGQVVTPASKKKDKVSFPCTVCPKKFATQEFLTNHLKNKHAA